MKKRDTSFGKMVEKVVGAGGRARINQDRTPSLGTRFKGECELAIILSYSQELWGHRQPL